MATAEVTLLGDAILGIDPGQIQRLVNLPVTVKLGRKKHKAVPSALKLGSYFSPERMTTPPPASINRRDAAAKSLAHMYLNDRYGCCVISGKGHAVGLWSANDAATEVIATDAEIYEQYQGICGPGDNGCYITEVLDVMRSKGFKANGVYHKIDGYASVDWTNKELVKVSQYLFGASTIGINLPQAWTTAAVWDVTSSAIVGGHDVTPIDYDDKGVYVSSWGRIYLITWAAFMSTRWLEEYYVLLAPLWYGSDNLAPCGIDTATLKADLVKVDVGVIPDIDPPTPPVPPVPPIPPPPVPGAGAEYTMVNDTDPAAFKAKCVDKLNAGWSLGDYNMIYLGLDTANGNKRLYYYGQSFYKLPVPVDHNN